MEGPCSGHSMGLYRLKKTAHRSAPLRLPEHVIRHDYVLPVTAVAVIRIVRREQQNGMCRRGDYPIGDDKSLCADLPTVIDATGRENEEVSFGIVCKEVVQRRHGASL